MLLLSAGSKAQVPVCTILHRTLSHCLCMVHMRICVPLPEMKLAALQALPRHSWLYAWVCLFLNDGQEQFVVLTVGWGSLQCCVWRISSAAPVASASAKARSVTTTWTAVTALMSKDAVSILPHTGDLVAASKLCFSPFLRVWFYSAKQTELVVPRINAS